MGFNDLSEDEQVQAMEKASPRHNITTLVPTKSDAELAKEFRDKVVDAYQPLLEILRQMDRCGFNMQCNVGKNGLGKFDILSLAIIKVYQEFG